MIIENFCCDKKVIFIKNLLKYTKSLLTYYEEYCFLVNENIDEINNNLFYKCEI